MSVYTTVSLEEARKWLTSYDFANATAIEAIHVGTVNSNYYLTINDKRYILTLFETLTVDYVAKILKLTEEMAIQGLRCPRPFANQQGEYLSQLANKPAALIECLPGKSIEVPTPQQCNAIGAYLAKMHLLTQDHPLALEDTMGQTWREQTLKALWPKLTQAEQSFATTIQTALQSVDLSVLPHGIIHADLFRDNALFVDENLEGVIDFYFACQGVLIYDLGILINDWCFEGTHFHYDKFQACLKGYTEHRPLTAIEHDAFPRILILAALRFWLSRLKSQHFPREGASVLRKDPKEIQRRLEHHLQNLELLGQKLANSG